MNHPKRWEPSEAERDDLWRRWKAGQSLNEIGRAFGKEHTVIHFLLACHGGIAPVARHRSRRVLTLAEREDVSRRIAGGRSLRVIAQRLSRACSTISREVTRHGGRAGYRASDADQRAWQLALHPKVCRLALHEKLRTTRSCSVTLTASLALVPAWRSQSWFCVNFRLTLDLHDPDNGVLFLIASGISDVDLFKMTLRKTVRLLATSLTLLALLAFSTVVVSDFDCHNAVDDAHCPYCHLGHQAPAQILAVPAVLMLKPVASVPVPQDAALSSGPDSLLTSPRAPPSL